MGWWNVNGKGAGCDVVRNISGILDVNSRTSQLPVLNSHSPALQHRPNNAGVLSKAMYRSNYSFPLPANRCELLMRHSSEKNAWKMDRLL